jgi:heptosyltransferase-2
VAGLGASHPSKDWPDYHWHTLLQRLRVTGNPSVFLIGGPKWQARAEDLRRNDPALINACDLPIMAAAALLRRATLFVGPDSGPLNLAAAAGTRAVGIFGLTPSLNYSALIRVVRGREGPTPLTSMEEIDPDRVFATVVSELRP